MPGVLTYSPTTRKLYLETGYSTTPVVASVPRGPPRSRAPSLATIDEKQEVGAGLHEYELVMSYDAENQAEEDEPSTRSSITPGGFFGLLLALYPVVLEFTSSQNAENLGAYYVIAGAALYFAACIECLAGKVHSVVAFLIIFWLWIGCAVIAHSVSLVALLPQAGATDRNVGGYAALWFGLLLSNLCVVGYQRMQRYNRARSRAVQI
ncbi:hypothetical protein EXIGLDRAFT_839227 [Exidia glandulosa HHB12029]|uniref:Uncharacterized protein n=1 Tax=Exidia glandulosa HHB12029 TaxID=1314781 RepID=A0A165F604_EXIGL|nr:hypothetical protein EXIGLDRAFT_839227 [Exidia glandulosa HHB12029]